MTKFNLTDFKEKKKLLLKFLSERLSDQEFIKISEKRNSPDKKRPSEFKKILNVCTKSI